jgi:DeoR/GlpR family transcriptional regulator of sugar metabolism
MKILELLRAEGRIVASDLSAVLGVSDDTVRRDLDDLAEEGKLQRVHGGALPRSEVGATYEDRQVQSAEGKLAVAREAVKLVEDGQVVLMDGGSTALRVVERLPLDLRATIVTHSPPVACALARHPSVEVVVVGGTLDKSMVEAVGGETIEVYSRINADLCMLGVWSLHPRAGVSYRSFEESRVARAMIESADRVVALATVDKLGTASPFVSAPAAALTHLATEPAAPEEMLVPYRELGIKILQGPALDRAAS